MEKKTVESICERKIEDQADAYYSRYRSYMKALNESTLCKVRGELNSGDVWSLGKQLEQWEDYLAVCEDAGNTNLLGKIPQIAMDVITAVHGASIVPIIAGVQPIDDEQGTVYFKNVRAETTRGDQTAGDILSDPRTGAVTPSGYASNYLTSTTDTVDATVLYNVALGEALRAGTIVVTTYSSSIFGQDDGKGNILGVGISGTVNYLTGAIALTFLANPGANTGGLVINYQYNQELATDLPKISTFFDSTSVRARVYALKATIGMLQSFGMRKRFGMIAEDEIARDLVSEINKEIGGDLIKQLSATALGTTQFDKTPPTNISYFEHKQTWKDKLADSEAVLVGNAGRGTISVLIVGREQAAVIQTLPGFVKLTDGNTLGSHVFGTIDGVTIVRVNEAAVLAAKSGIAIWKGMSPFEAPVVYAPYMPLVVTATLPEAPNPLGSMKAAAVWAGVQSLVPQFATKFNMIET